MLKLRICVSNPRGFLEIRISNVIEFSSRYAEHDPLSLSLRTSFSSLLQIENVQFLVFLDPSSLLSWELGVRVVLIIPRLQPLLPSPVPGVLRPSFRVLRPPISDLRPLYLNLIPLSYIGRGCIAPSCPCPRAFDIAISTFYVFFFFFSGSLHPSILSLKLILIEGYIQNFIE
ncbi:hypothetical protein PUN28_014140 [Cardiocondyla obscurior]|uniref:Uncharacterized protein n=1 Tax=Cardiocondyla obscurior TaxID=286306 RepID=A0AAW2F2V0_9HYME